MSRRRRHGAHEEEPENHERWLVSYADMVTLLFALFIVLYAMSVIDLNKYKAFQQSFNSELGQGVEAMAGEDDTPSGSQVDDAPGPEDGTVHAASTEQQVVAATVIGEAERVQLEELRERLLAALEAAGLAGAVEVALDDRGLVVFVSDAVLFSSGEAELLPQGRELLGRLGDVLSGVGNELVVEGHTDENPIATSRFPSNWELSTTRATTVLRWLVQERRLDASRVSAAGYADTHPRFPNDSAEHRARNRRVEVVVRAEAVPPAEPAAPADPAEGAEPPPDAGAGDAHAGEEPAEAPGH